MCHVNLDLDIEQHKRLFGMKEYRDERLFTLSQGQLEMRFPEGFGVPIRSDELLQVNTQVLNLNWPDKTFKVRHHVTIDYVRDRDCRIPISRWCKAAWWAWCRWKGARWPSMSMTRCPASARLAVPRARRRWIGPKDSTAMPTASATTGSSIRAARNIARGPRRP